jgi:NodT family efflux transporter outer membrane factor (OMF) lipoprotein
LFKRMRNYQITLITLFLSILQTSCMVGPNFHSPAAPQTNQYTAGVQPEKTISAPKAGAAGKSQYFMTGKDIPAEWWTLFHSKELNDLVCKGLARSPNLAAAEAALREAQETLRAQIGASMYPAANLQLSAERQSLSAASFGGGDSVSLFNLYNATVNVSYTLDTFGGLRREIESLRDQVYYQNFELEAARLTLTSNIVTTAIANASARAQIQATKDLINSQQAQLKIVERQFHVGGASRADILTQQSALAQTRATLPPLEQSLAKSNHALAVLVGELPSESNLPAFELKHLNLPSQLPISLPSLLVRQRPDVRASEALFAAASAQVGVATANLFPQITLGANYGFTGTSTSNFFAPDNKIWSLSTNLTQPIFNGGSLRAKKRAAVAAFEQAGAQYRETVLQAFQNVADTLRALQHDAEALRAQKEAEIAARNSMQLTQTQFSLGGVGYLSLLTAQRQYQQARINRIQAEAARYSDTAALFQALGGGWWNRNLAMAKATVYKA